MAQTSPGEVCEVAIPVESHAIEGASATVRSSEARRSQTSETGATAAPDSDAEGRRERRDAIRRANLLKAVAAHKADRSAYYASGFRHGFYAPDLERSAEAAG